MRLVNLHQTTATAPVTTTTSGQGIEPRTSLVGLSARVFGAEGTPVAATFSAMGSVPGFAPEPILFGGASIISLAGTTSDQWQGTVENCLYKSVNIDLHSLSSVTSFQADATEPEV